MEEICITEDIVFEIFGIFIEWPCRSFRVIVNHVDLIRSPNSRQ